MAIETTLLVLKPDAMKKSLTDKHLVEDILQRYLRTNLTVIRRKDLRMNGKIATEFYKEHKGRSYFEGLVLAMTSGRSLFLILEGPNAIKTVREINGATNPAHAVVGTVRHDFPSAGGPFNMVHGSDSAKAAEREIKLIFNGKKRGARKSSRR